MRGKLITSPPTLLLLILAMGVLAMADFSVKEASGKISPSLGTLIYALTASSVALVWVFWSRSQEPLFMTSWGLVWSIATGVTFGTLVVLLFTVFTAGVNLSIGTPVIRLGGIMLAAMLGILVFRESVSLRYVIGFALAVVGILLIVTQ
jgi:drug/metabolite transporter (DMT)-like permease